MKRLFGFGVISLSIFGVSPADSSKNRMDDFQLSLSSLEKVVRTPTAPSVEDSIACRLYFDLLDLVDRGVYDAKRLSTACFFTEKGLFLNGISTSRDFENLLFFLDDKLVFTVEISEDFVDIERILDPDSVIFRVAFSVSAESNGGLNALGKFLDDRKEGVSVKIGMVDGSSTNGVPVVVVSRP